MMTKKMTAAVAAALEMTAAVAAALEMTAAVAAALEMTNEARLRISGKRFPTQVDIQDRPCQAMPRTELAVG